MSNRCRCTDRKNVSAINIAKAAAADIKLISLCMLKMEVRYFQPNARTVVV